MLQVIEDVLVSRQRLPDFESEAMPHINDLYQSAVRLLLDESTAGDAVQETYLVAWKTFDRYQRGTNCRAWLFKILFHVIHHHRRKWFSIRTLTDSDEMLETLLTYEPPVPEEITDEDILAALDKVPESFREVLLLVDVQEFSYKEVSEILKVPIGTVMSRLSRGRAVLRAQLSGLAITPREEIAKAVGARA